LTLHHLHSSHSSFFLSSLHFSSILKSLFLSLFPHNSNTQCETSSEFFKFSRLGPKQI
jgi:hypothetical protein